MATKNYMINDKWLDLDKQNIVELQSVDGVLDTLKVNGSEIVTPSGKITITENGTNIDIAQYALADVNVEGGGGSSDLSTAIMTISGFPDDEFLQVPGGKAVSVIYINSRLGITTSGIDEVLSNGTYDVVLYQGSQMALIDDTSDCTVSGDATLDAGSGRLTITGNFTIAYNGE